MLMSTSNLVCVRNAPAWMKCNPSRCTELHDLQQLHCSGCIIFFIMKNMPPLMSMTRFSANGRGRYFWIPFSLSIRNFLQPRKVWDIFDQIHFLFCKQCSDQIAFTKEAYATGTLQFTVRVLASKDSDLFVGVTTDVSGAVPFLKTTHLHTCFIFSQD